jgi:hypothetical protein
MRQRRSCISSAARLTGAPWRWTAGTEKSTETGAELEAGDGGEGFFAHAAEEGGDAGGEFVGVEGFGEVVVGAEVEALHRGRRPGRGR